MILKHSCFLDLSTDKYNDLPGHLFLCTQRSHPFQVIIRSITWSSISPSIQLTNYLLKYSRRAVLRQSMAYWKDKLGHTTIDLGIAPEKLESYHNGDIKNTDPLERLQSVRGHLVSFPLDFMCKEDLRPVFNESEYYASQVFYWVPIVEDPNQRGALAGFSFSL